MFKVFCLTAATLGMGVLLSACASSPQNEAVLPQVTFSHVVPNILPVVDADIIESYASKPTPPSFSVAVDKAVKQYLNNKIVGRGSGKTVFQSDVQDISVAYTQRSSENEFWSFVGVGRMDVYDINVEIAYREKTLAGDVVKEARTAVQRQVSISEHESLFAREFAQKTAVINLMRDVDAETDKILRQWF